MKKTWKIAVLTGLILLTVVFNNALCGGSQSKTGSGGGFTVLTMRWGTMGDSFAQNKWIKDLETRTGVKINWQVVSSSDWGEQKQIMLAGGELPDIVFGNGTFDDVDIMNNLEYFLPLDDLIDKNMPNYKAAMAAIPAFKAITTYPDGKTYSLAKNLPARPVACNQPIINKVWLDRLGLKVPTTLDELTAVLRAFKQQDANGNGNPDDEFPIAFAKDYSIDLLNPFGLDDYRAIGITSIDGRFQFVPAHTRYRDAMKWLNQLYQEGILDPESFTQDDQMLRGKRQAEDAPRVGFMYAWSADADFGKWSDQYIVIPPIKGPDGKAYAFGDSNGVHSVQRNEVLISKTCKDPAAAARWIDNFYDSEASIQNFWGAIGTVITKNSDGTYRLNNPPAGTSADAWYWDQSLRDFGPKYIAPGFSDKIKLDPTVGDGLKLEVAKLANSIVTDPFPAVIHTQTETNELATLWADISSYTAQMRAKWVTQGGIDAEWNGYIDQLNKMGVQRYMEIKMAAYNRIR
ncbi:ABC transporter substrate-binding protein [Spirochaetia bacterium]|nr:ABC transporter substrate-binding protein [Spirochaetia bacterium]